MKVELNQKGVELSQNELLKKELSNVTPASTDFIIINKQTGKLYFSQLGNAPTHFCKNKRSLYNTKIINFAKKIFKYIYLNSVKFNCRNNVSYSRRGYYLKIIQCSDNKCYFLI